MSGLTASDRKTVMEIAVEPTSELPSDKLKNLVRNQLNLDGAKSMSPLSELGYKVFQMYRDGKSIKEIAKELKLPWGEERNIYECTRAINHYIKRLQVANGITPKCEIIIGRDSKLYYNA